MSNCIKTETMHDRVQRVLDDPHHPLHARFREVARETQTLAWFRLAELEFLLDHHDPGDSEEPPHSL